MFQCKLCHQLWFLIQPEEEIPNGGWNLGLWTKEHLGMGFGFALMIPKCREVLKQEELIHPPFNLSHDLNTLQLTFP